MINLGRTRMQPFTDKQIELIADFAAQAAIALEITRRERQYREVQNELAHANRVLTMGQLTASIAHELRQPLGAVLNDGKASLNCSRDTRQKLKKQNYALRRRSRMSTEPLM